jgi:hypothetical protein
MVQPGLHFKKHELIWAAYPPSIPAVCIFNSGIQDKKYKRAPFKSGCVPFDAKKND